MTIWWCKEHDASFQREADPNPPTWRCWYFADVHPNDEVQMDRCRPVEMHLVPVEPET